MKKQVRTSRWYGWEIAATDVAAGFVAWYSQPATLVMLGTGPVIHLFNGEKERAQASLAARVAGAGAGMAVAAIVRANEKCVSGHSDTTINPNAGDTCPVDARRVLIGAAFGLAAASAVDVIIFGWTSTADGDKALPSPGDDEVARRPARWTPGLALMPDGLALSLSGTF